MKTTNWSKEELAFLQEKWGILSKKTIAKKLDRTVCAISNKAYQLGLGSFLSNSEYISWNQLMITLGYPVGGYTYRRKSWIKERNFPIVTKLVNENTFKMVNIDEFWKWAEKNQSFLDFSKFEENSIGAEPEWVKFKRRNDYEALKNTYDNWTKSDDEKLIYLLKKHKYTFKNLSEKFGRTEGAISCRIQKLGIKDRPFYDGKQNKWTESEIEELTKLLKLGISYTLMAKKLNKSERSVRSFLYRAYGTGKLDAIRENVIC